MYDKIHRARMGKRWRALEKCARQLLASEPNSVYAIQLLGEALEKQQKVAQALQSYELALAIDSAEKAETIGQTFFLRRLDILYHRARRYEDCHRVCEYYTRRHPDSWDGWNRLRRAAKRIGDASLSAKAKEHADEIRERQEARRRAEEQKQDRFTAIYEEKLRAMGYDPEAMAQEGPHPSFDASDEEWGEWVRRTTDGERIDAEISAGLDAIRELEWEELNERLGPPRPMGAEERRRLLLRTFGQLPEAGRSGFITYTDRSFPDNWVQLTDEVCVVSLRNWNGAAPLKAAQVQALRARGFHSSPDNVIRHKGLSTGELAALIEELFEILGSTADFELVVEMTDS